MKLKLLRQQTAWLGIGLLLLFVAPVALAREEQNQLSDADLGGAVHHTATVWHFFRGTPEGKIVWGVASSGAGGNYLFIQKKDEGTHDHCWWGQRITAREGDIYRLTFSAKSSGVGDHEAAVGVDFYGPDGKPLGFDALQRISYVSSLYQGNRQPDPATWTDFECGFKVPRGATSLSLRFALDGTAPAEADFRNIALRMPAVPLSTVLDRAPSEIPVFRISPAPVTASAVTLTPDWRTEGAEIRRSATRQELCLNGLWAVQPATGGQPPVADDWGFMKVPSVFGSRELYKIYGQEKTTWSKKNQKTATPLWFVRDVEIPEATSGKVRLFVSSMRGVAVQAYWNGRAVGRLTDQLGGTVDLSAAAKPGEKGQLALYLLPTSPEMLYASLMEAGQMPRQYDPGAASQVTMSGLSDLFLTVEPASPMIGRVQVIPSVRQRKLEIRIAGGPSSRAADHYGVVIRDLKGSPVITQEGLKAEERDGTWVLSLPWENPHLWNPEDPFLYEYTVRACDLLGNSLDETLPEKFGFREVAVRGKELLLNERPLRLHPRLATTLFMDGAAVRREFSFLKDMGFNCVLRPSVGNTHELEVWATQSLEDFYRIADETGMLVIPYVPYSIISGGQFGGGGLGQTDNALLLRYLAKNQTERLANHPSVIAYSGFGAGYYDGIHPVNVRPDIWGVSPLRTPGILEKVLPDPSARKAAMVNIQKSKEFISDFKRLDPSRPFLSHFDGGEGDGWGIFDYFNWTPLQEWENWPERWAKEGVMPIGSTEHGLPYPSSFLNHGIPDGNNEPWVSEYAAMRIGVRAYSQEPPSYLEFIRSSYNPTTGGFAPKIGADHQFASDTVRQNWENTQAVWVENTKAIYRAWRTMGVPMGIEPFGHADQYLSKDTLRKGNGSVVADPAQELRSVGGKLDSWSFDSYWPSETMPWLPASPTGGKPEGLTPLGEVLCEVNSPLLAYIAGSPGRETGKDHVFWSGEKIAKQIALVWDGFHQRRLDVSWRLLVAGKEISKGAQQLVLDAGDIRFVPIGFSAPAVDARSTGTIEMEVRDGEKTVASDTFALQVYPSWHLPENLKSLKITLFDPSGESLAAFGRLGLSATSIRSLSEWKGGDVLVIGRGALPALKDQSFAAIPAPILVLEQSAEALEKLGFRAYPIRTRTVFPLIPGHPIMEGVGAEDLCNWRVNPKLLPSGVEPLRDGYNYHTGYLGTVASVTIETPTRGNFTPLLQTGFDLRETPLLEARLQGRRCLFCQLSLLDPLLGDAKAPLSDPVAARLLGNMLAFLVSPVVQTASCSLLGGDSSLLNALGAPSLRNIASMKEIGGDRVLIVDQATAEHAQLKEWVHDGGTAVIMPQEQVFYHECLPSTEVRKATGSLFPLPEGANFAGLSQSDFHFRQSLPVLRFPNGSVASEIADGKGRWILLGFDPRRLDLKKEPFLCLTFRHQYRALAQILTNVGVSLEKPVEELVGSMSRDVVGVDVSREGTALLAENKGSSLDWTKPDYDDASWVPFYINGQVAPFGDALVRIRFRVPDNIKTQELLADLGTMDDYDESYLNGTKLGSVNPANSDPDRAYAIPRVYPLAGNLLRPGQENLLAIRFWNRNAITKGAKAFLRGPLRLRIVSERSPYVGTYKHSDDPYLQHYW